MEVLRASLAPASLPPPSPAKREAGICGGRASGNWFSLTLPVSGQPGPWILCGGGSQALIAPFVILGCLRDGDVRAVSYEDVVGAAASAQRQALDFDAVGLANSVTAFVSGNSLAVFSGAAAVAVLVILSKLLGGSKNWGSVSARDAFEKLGDEQAAILDIRLAADIKVEGTPDVRAYRKRVMQIPYLSEDSTLVQRVLAKFKSPSNTVIYILDRFDGNSLAVAKLLASNGFRAAYAIKNGAEGPNGWQKSQLPWLMPQKGFAFDGGALKDIIDSAVNENPNLVPATLGVAAAAGVGLAVFSEVEAVLQLVGSAALVQLFVKKLLFAEDRKRTLSQLESFLNTKVAPMELVDEIKVLGKAVVPKNKDRSLKLSAYTSTSSLNSEASKSVQEEITEKSKEKTLGMTIEDTGAKYQIFDSPTNLATLTDLSQSTRPLSPYGQYPDLKPPTSPTPSRP